MWLTDGPGKHDSVGSIAKCSFHHQSLSKLDDNTPLDIVKRTLLSARHDQSNWAVHSILAKCIMKGSWQYLILWDGFPVCDATWEPR